MNPIYLFYMHVCNLFTLTTGVKQYEIVIYTQAEGQLNKGLGTQEKVVGLGQDKIRGRGEQMTLPRDTPPPPEVDTAGILSPGTCSYREQIPFTPEGDDQHTPENTTLASNWTEMKARVARASTGNSCVYHKCISL